MSDHVSRLDYCQYLLVSQINYTLTNFADHCERFSPDAVTATCSANALRRASSATTCARNWP
jgi:hypothetical protein